MARTSDTPLLRLDKGALFSLLGYQPHPGQALVHASNAQRKVLAAGARWGKSRCATMELLAWLLEPAGPRNGWIVGPRFEVVDRLLDDVVGALEAHMPHRLVEIDRRRRRVVAQSLSGAQVVVEGRCSERIASLLGASLDFVLVDEAGRVADEAWEGALSQRLVDRSGRALICGTPRYEGTWVHRLFELGMAGEPGIDAWSGRTVDNPTIDPEVIEAERARLSRSEFASEYEGRFLGPSGEPTCSTCNGPDRGCRSVVVLMPGEELKRCPDCDGPLDRDGQPVGVYRDGELHVTVISTDDFQPPTDEF